MHEKELRLALVCYGGISLAVYMHGITKEIWKLTRASRAFHADGNGLSLSEQLYLELLRKIAADNNLTLRVLTDIITGASAGGINGIFLAQAVATGQSLEPLTDLWLEKADVDVLLDPDARPLGKFTKFWAAPIAWYAANRQGGTIDTTVASEAREEVRAKLTRFVRSRWFEPPFGGQVLSGMILDAFDLMAGSPPDGSLLPPGQPLDLAVTVTDFHGHPETLQLNSPPRVVENEHRLVIRFRHDPEQEISLGSTIALTFAARATSSFPGAFPPFKLRELDSLVSARGTQWPDRAPFLSSIIPQSGKLVDDISLVDGSVLANAPFKAAIEALRDRPARREVDRRFVFIDPKPGIRAISLNRPGKGDLPGFFTTILGAMSELPREQPIRDNLEDIAARSTRIRRMQHIVDALTPDIDAAVQALFGKTFFIDKPTPKRVAAWRAKAHDRATADAGYAYAGYAHLKLAGIVEGLADLAARIAATRNEALPEDFRHRLWAEIRARGIDDIRLPGEGRNNTTIAFFRAHDLGFRIRRLRFMARRLTALVDSGEAVDAEIVNLRHVIYASLAPLIDLENAATYRTISLASPSTFLDDVATLQALPQRDEAVDIALAGGLIACPRAHRRQSLLAYLGFPYFDISTLPMLQGEGLEEFNPIKVDRISPDDAQSIRRGGAAATLKGIEFNSFGAFFSRKYRENDYLWGRLHGAERMVDIVYSTLTSPAPAQEIMAAKRALFEAILTEEEPRLTNIAELFASLRQEVARVPLENAATTD